jgi:hypothetical protein
MASGCWGEADAFRGYQLVKVVRFALLTVSTLTSLVYGKRSTSFPTTAMEYRVRYSIYRINASDAHEAKQKVIELIQRRPQDWISVEPAPPRRGFWKTLFLGS